MARPVKTTTNITISAIISSYLADKSVVSTEVHVGDTVKDLKYVTEDGEVTSVSGRVSEIDYSGWKKTDGKGGNVNSKGSFKSESVIKSLTIDSSQIYKSIVRVIPAKEILEYGVADGEVVRVGIEGKMTADISVTLSDGKESNMTVVEGQKVFFLKTMKDGSSVTGDYVVDSFIYTTNAVGKASVKGLRLIGDDNNVIDLPFEAIISCGQEAIEVVDDDAFNTAIDGSGEKGIVVSAGEFTKAITVGTDKTVIESSKNANEPANTGKRATDEIGKNETVLAGKITLEEASNVIIQGVTISSDALVDATAAESVKFKNCKFVDVTPDKSKSYLIKASKKADEATKFEFEGCYFGNNTTEGSNKMYNLFEINGRIADGSTFSDNYFTKECCTHNMFNFYEVEEGATIEVNNNVFEYSANAMRVGFKGNAKATININNNEYKETDTQLGGDWAGYLLVQPYGKQTESFENVTININNMKRPDDGSQIGYVYCGSADTQLTDEQMPKVFVDGKKVSLPVRH